MRIFTRRHWQRLALPLLCALAACGTTHHALVPPAPTPAADQLSAAGNAMAHQANLLTHDQLVAMANQYIATMSLDEKIGQLLVPEIATDGYNGDTVSLIQQVHPGAVITYYTQLSDAATAIDLNAGIQKNSRIPVLTTLDMEGGYVDNLQRIDTPELPSAWAVGTKDDPNYAYAVGTMVAQRMLALGFNTDLAPVADVELVNGPDQQARDFGTTPDLVTKMAGPWLNGLQEHGVIGTLKHFPGLGSASCDAHKCLPVINSSRDQIEQVDLAPYRALLSGPEPPGMIMSTDLLMPALDPTWPAELSPAIITGVLRGELHYDGVVITDALFQKGITIPPIQAGVQALVAGCDLLIGSYQTPYTLYWIQGIKDAIDAGTLSVARIEQSVRRILILKLQRGLLPTVPLTPASHAQAFVAPATPVARRDDE